MYLKLGREIMKCYELNGKVFDDEKEFLKEYVEHIHNKVERFNDLLTEMKNIEKTMLNVPEVAVDKSEPVILLGLGFANILATKNLKRFDSYYDKSMLKLRLVIRDSIINTQMLSKMETSGKYRKMEEILKSQNQDLIKEIKNINVITPAIKQVLLTYIETNNELIHSAIKMNSELAYYAEKKLASIIAKESKINKEKEL